MKNYSRLFGYALTLIILFFLIRTLYTTWSQVTGSGFEFSFNGAMLAASLLRETMWSMISEITSVIEFDYVSYTQENLGRFEAAYVAFEEMEKS